MEGRDGYFEQAGENASGVALFTLNPDGSPGPAQRGTFVSFDQILASRQANDLALDRFVVRDLVAPASVALGDLSRAAPDMRIETLRASGFTLDTSLTLARAIGSARSSSVFNPEQIFTVRGVDYQWRETPNGSVKTAITYANDGVRAAHMRDFWALQDQMRASPVGTIAYGVSKGLGGDETVSRLALAGGTAFEGLALGASGRTPATNWTGVYTGSLPRPTGPAITYDPRVGISRGSGALSAAEGAGGKAIIVTPMGVAIAPEVLSLQGTSRFVGDFRGIQGATIEDIVSRVPSNWTLLPQKQGMGIRFVDELGMERLRLHGPTAAAPAGSNSASGWTARVHGPNNQYYDNLGNLVGRKNNAGHIPIWGNPNVGP